VFFFGMSLGWMGDFWHWDGVGVRKCVRMMRVEYTILFIHVQTCLHMDLSSVALSYHHLSSAISGEPLLLNPGGRSYASKSARVFSEDSKSEESSLRYSS
jgi:hypothetical protein